MDANWEWLLPRSHLFRKLFSCKAHSLARSCCTRSTFLFATSAPISVKFLPHPEIMKPKFPLIFTLTALVALAALGCRAPEANPPPAQTAETINAENQAILKTLGIENCTRVAAYGIGPTTSGPNEGILEGFDGKPGLNPERFPLAGLTLTNPQLSDFLKSGMTKHVPDGSYWSIACYDPRHGVVFFDKTGAALSKISICLECKKFRTFPNHSNWGDDMAIDFAALGKLFSSIGLPVEDH